MRVRASRVLVHLRRQWMGALALFLVLTGGVAYAADTVFSTDIVNNRGLFRGRPRRHFGGTAGSGTSTSRPAR